MLDMTKARPGDAMPSRKGAQRDDGTAPVLQARGLSKAYGPVTVLSDVTLDILPGEVHAVIGENGAGKSTLMRLLSGHAEPSAGTLSMDGRKIVFPTPTAAQEAGIVLVHQEILLADALTVTENLFLGRERTKGGLVDDNGMKRLAVTKLAEIGCHALASALVRDVSLADRQLVQIARALLEDHRVVILDEPTAVLTHDEVDTLIGLVERLKERGVAVLYISHRLDEVERLADRITVLRDGEMVGTYEGGTLGQMDMANLMVGRELSSLYPDRRTASFGEPMLEIAHAQVPGHVKDASFTLYRGEILGFAGMVGAGRTELFQGLLGLRPGSAKSVRLRGEEVRFRTPLEAMLRGIGYLTEDRKGKGLLLQEPLAPNLTLSALGRFNPGLLLSRRREDTALRQAVADYDIRARRLDMAAGQLSGGNQQKLLLAKIMMTDPSIIVIDEPTRGIDIANKAQIYSFIQRFVAEGRSCVVISSEMQELIGICDRILVMREGAINGELSGDEMTEGNVAFLATSTRKVRETTSGGTQE